MTRCDVRVLLVGLAACGGTPTSGTTTPPPPPPASTSTVAEGALTSIATGDALSCVLEKGRVLCWGLLGDNESTTEHLTPRAIDNQLQLAQLSVFGRVACGVGTDGAGYCWGPNTDGQLGIGSASDGTKTPARLKTGETFKMIAAGDPTTCALTTDGQAFCWGDNTHGQVGNGAAGPDVVSPAPVAGGLTFSSISMSATFACGVTTAGDAYCWGANASGQLGTGAPISSNTADIKPAPVKVTGGHTWKSVTTGQFFACGLTTAGAAMCWGENNYQFGDGTSTHSSTPVAVKGGITFTQLDAGRDFTCGVAERGTTHCWGANNVGELGNANQTPQDLSRIPVRVVSDQRFAEVSASSGSHVCALTSNRTRAYCWGRNDNGQLGNGSKTTAATVRTGTPTVVSI